MEECLDGPARITSKELAPIHSVKNGILVLQVGEWMPIWEKVLSFAPQGGRTAVKKNERHQRTRRPILRLLIKFTTNRLRIPEYGAPKVFIVYGRAQTFGNRSDMFDSRKPCDVMLTFKTSKKEGGREDLEERGRKRRDLEE